MKKGSEAAEDGELEDEVEPTLDPEPEKAGSVWVVDVGDDPELRQKVSDSLFFLVLLDEPLHRHELAVGQTPFVHLCVSPFPDQVLCQK